MRVKVMSDLHLDRFGGVERVSGFIKSVPVDDCDVLVLAGDIADAHNVGQYLNWFASRFNHVVYVHGNHEFYGRSLAHFEQGAFTVANYPLQRNVHVLDDSFTIIDGQCFVGSTLWFPRSWLINSRFRRDWNDFSLIEDFEPTVYRLNARAVRFLEDHVGVGDVVVTHYLPSALSIHRLYCEPEWRDGNAIFCCPLDDVIRDASPSLWIHGHTHKSCDYELAGSRTRVVCNPHGYVDTRDQNPEFDPKFVVEV